VGEVSPHLCLKWGAHFFVRFPFSHKWGKGGCTKKEQRKEKTKKEGEALFLFTNIKESCLR